MGRGRIHYFFLIQKLFAHLLKIICSQVCSSYALAIGQKTLTQPKTPQTFQFTAEQLTKFVANVVIQIAQPQVCYPNPKQDMLDLKSSMCRKISNATKSILSIDITGKELFESIGSLSAPAP